MEDKNVEPKEKVTEEETNMTDDEISDEVADEIANRDIPDCWDI